MNKKPATDETISNRLHSVKSILKLIQADLMSEAPDDGFHRDMNRALDGVIALCGMAPDAGADSGKAVTA